ncbi:Sporulation protein YtfJ [Alkaliphilus metalliredigens QYMF]|uniref:Sporulation protein YtfJ n=1 Tax=Alkaliphilus metalliredigens (strain QYMF) TaxID=293826 RepID=A6TRH9_ALKMQ|nr:GerW family sporulation protein [Alkaliphilus metalliredigens]ABR48797.1 Sporulation protein YtfJ [Alkaliphilus metalliredigens QYMF]
MNEHPIEALMKTTMESIKEMVDVNTIVGDPVETPDGTVIIPISKVSFGFASGGGEYINEQKNKSEDGEEKSTKDKFPFAGGAGAGVSVQPVAFMVVGNGLMKLMSVDQNANMIDNLINTAPQVINNIQSMFSKKGKPPQQSENEVITYE